MIGHDAAARGQVYAAHFLWQAGRQKQKGQRIMPQGRRLCLTHAPLVLNGRGPALLRGHSELTSDSRQGENFKENIIHPYGAAQRLQVLDPR